jgi:hypothetical protein
VDLKKWMMINMSEQIKYSIEDEEFFIEKITGYGINEKYEKLPLSAWKLLKEVQVFIHVQRQIEKTDFNNPIQIVNYSLPLTYSILNTATGKNIYLRLEKKAFDIAKRDNIRANWVTVYLKNVDTSVCEEAPLPNKLFSAGDWDFLSIKKGEAIEVDKKQLIELYKSGLCLGTFDFSLQNRLV